MVIAQGATLGPYTISEQLGRGGMAAVYRAYHAPLDRYVAIKVMLPVISQDPGFRERFEQEARAVARFRHPNIVTIHDFGEQQGLAYLVTELIEGGTLAEQTGSPLDPGMVVRVIGPIASALDYAHERGVLHRDVKPSNILLRADLTPVLSDFGIAKLSNSSAHMTRTGLVMGTPAYQAPEQASGEPASDATDQYALGIVAYELLTGRVPFSAETPMAVLLAHLVKPLPPPREINPALSGEIEQVLLKTLAKRPDERYATVSGFAMELAEAVTIGGYGPMVAPGPTPSSAAPSTPAWLGTPRTPVQPPFVSPEAAAFRPPATVEPPSHTPSQPPSARPAVEAPRPPSTGTPPADVGAEGRVAPPSPSAGGREIAAHPSPLPGSAASLAATATPAPVQTPPTEPVPTATQGADVAASQPSSPGGRPPDTPAGATVAEPLPKVELPAALEPLPPVQVPAPLSPLPSMDRPGAPGPGRYGTPAPTALTPAVGRTRPGTRGLSLPLVGGAAAVIVAGALAVLVLARQPSPVPSPTAVPTVAPAAGAVATVLASAKTAAPTLLATALPTPAPTAAPTPAPASQPTAAPTVASQVAPTGAPAATATPGEEQAWQRQEAALNAIWGKDWPKTIAQLTAFVKRYPNNTDAKDKLYAALISYGDQLSQAGDKAGAAAQYAAAHQVYPDRPEASAALAALTPTPVPTPAPVPPPVQQQPPAQQPPVQRSPVQQPPAQQPQVQQPKAPRAFTPVAERIRLATPTPTATPTGWQHP